MTNSAGLIPGPTVFIADLEKAVPEHLLPHVAKPNRSQLSYR
ncbi:hypothetical protein MB901379_03892 [Mycobacterium basiliense]|uniref:Uncharacterized protein n=1 Tax=Mycobacterium basiliense TaxID=2094119 RepID=A0A447GIH4_9MYCO|nr:hypothetical protein [Mycobacterium basiliense]VDM90296.1 hypothetical protein MB901379_03892 [Mycobacterium basiliense]